MELRYRGSCYHVNIQPNAQSIDTVETEVPLRFLGRSYQMRKVERQVSMQLNQHLRFRGILYSAN